MSAAQHFETQLSCFTKSVCAVGHVRRLTAPSGCGSSIRLSLTADLFPLTELLLLQTTKNNTDTQTSCGSARARVSEPNEIRCIPRIPCLLNSAFYYLCTLCHPTASNQAADEKQVNKKVFEIFNRTLNEMNMYERICNDATQHCFCSNQRKCLNTPYAPTLAWKSDIYNHWCLK